MVLEIRVVSHGVCMRVRRPLVAGIPESEMKWSENALRMKWGDLPRKILRYFLKGGKRIRREAPEKICVLGFQNEIL